MSWTNPTYSAAIAAMAVASVGFIATSITFYFTTRKTHSRREKTADMPRAVASETPSIDITTAQGKDIHIPIDPGTSPEEKAKLEELAKIIAEQVETPENNRQGNST
jgi:hypothetical protein